MVQIELQPHGVVGQAGEEGPRLKPVEFTRKSGGKLDCRVVHDKALRAAQLAAQPGLHVLDFTRQRLTVDSVLAERPVVDAIEKGQIGLRLGGLHRPFPACAAMASAIEA